MPQSPARTLRHLAASLGLSLSIFALPWWSLSHPIHQPIATREGAPVGLERTAVFLSQPSPRSPEPTTLPTPSDAAEESPAEKVVEEATREAVVASTPLSGPTPAAEAGLPLVEAPSPANPRQRLQALTRKTAAATRSVGTAPSGDSAKQSRAEQPGRRRTRNAQRDCRPDAPQVERTQPGSWNVERSLIDHYAKNLRAAEDLAHVAWARDASDAIIGFRVVRVRCGSPLWEAGFENGDLITNINGHRVRTVPQALAAYVTLRVKRKLRVRGQRKDGSPFDHRYRLT